MSKVRSSGGSKHRRRSTAKKNKVSRRNSHSTSRKSRRWRFQGGNVAATVQHGGASLEKIQIVLFFSILFFVIMSRSSAATDILAFHQYAPRRSVYNTRRSHATAAAAAAASNAAAASASTYIDDDDFEQSALQSGVITIHHPSRTTNKKSIFDAPADFFVKSILKLCKTQDMALFALYLIYDGLKFFRTDDAFDNNGHPIKLLRVSKTDIEKLQIMMDAIATHLSQEVINIPLGNIIRFISRNPDALIANVKRIIEVINDHEMKSSANPEIIFIDAASFSASDAYVNKIHAELIKNYSELMPTAVRPNGFGKTIVKTVARVGFLRSTAFLVKPKLIRNESVKALKKEGILITKEIISRFRLTDMNKDERKLITLFLQRVCLPVVEKTLLKSKAEHENARKTIAEFQSLLGPHAVLQVTRFLNNKISASEAVMIAQRYADEEKLANAAAARHRHSAP